MRQAMPQVHVALHILGWKTGTGRRYTSGLMFWVDKKVPGTGQVTNTSWASDTPAAASPALRFLRVESENSYVHRSDTPAGAAHALRFL